MKNKIAAVMIIVGLVAGPGYLVYCLFISGNTIGEHVVFNQDMSEPKALGVRVTSAKNASWNIPVNVHLSPEMNPIRIGATIRYLPPTGVTIKSTQYVAELKNGIETVWQEPFAVSVSRDKDKKDKVKIGSHLQSLTISIKAFSVANEGDYELYVSQKGEREIVVGQVKVNIRENVIMPIMPIAAAGLVIFVLGIVTALVGNRPKT